MRRGPASNIALIKGFLGQNKTAVGCLPGIAKPENELIVQVRAAAPQGRNRRFRDKTPSRRTGPSFSSFGALAERSPTEEPLAQPDSGERLPSSFLDEGREGASAIPPGNPERDKRSCKTDMRLGANILPRVRSILFCPSSRSLAKPGTAFCREIADFDLEAPRSGAE